MKVHVLIWAEDGPHSPRKWVLGVFSTKEQAQAYMDADVDRRASKRLLRPNEDYTISEFTVDSPSIFNEVMM